MSSFLTFMKICCYCLPKSNERAVPGATGFLGSHRVSALLAADWSVRGLVHTQEKARTAPSDLDVVVILVEIADEELYFRTVYLTGTLTQLIKQRVRIERCPFALRRADRVDLRSQATTRAR